MTTGPSHHSVLALDVEGYSRRNELAQGSIRDTMYSCAREAASDCDLPWGECVALDRGDSIILLVPPSVTPAILIDPFVARLDAVLRRHATLSSPAAAVRMRVAVHAGFISPDDHGWVGDAINRTSRLLDAHVLRDVLAASTRTHTALIVSDDLHRAMVVAGHVGLSPETFHSVRVRVKETDVPAWIHVPGYLCPDGLPAKPEDSSDTGADNATQPPAPPASGHPSAIITGNAKVGGGISAGDIHVSFGGGLR